MTGRGISGIRFSFLRRTRISLQVLVLDLHRPPLWPSYPLASLRSFFLFFTCSSFSSHPTQLEVNFQSFLLLHVPQVDYFLMQYSQVFSQSSSLFYVLDIGYDSFTAYCSLSSSPEHPMVFRKRRLPSDCLPWSSESWSIKAGSSCLKSVLFLLPDRPLVL